MRRTSVNLEESHINDLKDIENRTGKKRNEIIREAVKQYTDINSHISSVASLSKSGTLSNRTARLTESANKQSLGTDVIAYTYAGALQYLEQEKMIALVTQLYSQDPLAHRIIEAISDFCIGEGYTWETIDSVLEERLEEFWIHPRNNLHITQYQRVSELLLYGEQCYPAFVNSKTGIVKLGNVNPSFIKQTILDPDDYHMVIGVELNTNGTPRTYRTIFPGHDDDEDLFNSKALSLRANMDGDCFYFPINSLSLPMTAAGFGDKQYQIRGRSELLPLIDRLGIMDDLNYLNLDRIQILLSVIYDIEVAQASPKEIKAIIDEFGLPNGPSVRAHDDKMKIKVESPKLGSTEISTLFTLLRDEIIGGAGIPPHWIGKGEANRASAMSMELPTLKKLRAKQKMISLMFDQIIDYQVFQFKKLDLIDKDSYAIVRVPSITRKDMINIGDSLVKSVPNLVTAVTNGWITNDDAGKIFRELADYGVDLQVPENIIINDIATMSLEGKVTDEGMTTHDYIALDNPEEELEDKQERDQSRQVSTGYDE